MSIPPGLIRVKRKRDDDTPVTFLQFDSGVKRHRSDSNWIYQRRDSRASADSASTTRPNAPRPSALGLDPRQSSQDSDGGGHGHAGPEHPSEARPSMPQLQSALSNAGASHRPRRFHISRATMSPTVNESHRSGISRARKHGPALFVERSRKKTTSTTPGTDNSTSQPRTIDRQVPRQGTDSPYANIEYKPDEPRRLKKPGVVTKPKPMASQPQPGTLVSRPLPAVDRSEDLEKIAAEMNDWVMNEIGTNLQNMQEESEKAKALKYRPKVPVKRYKERHPESIQHPDAAMNGTDEPMEGVSEDEDEEGDWIIEEYVRVPAGLMAVDVDVSDVGILILEGDEDNYLFYGPDEDDDEDYFEDEEDENAENHYTADYPEEEVDSNDEYDRNPYTFRTDNASDSEEFDEDEYESEEDEMVIEGESEFKKLVRLRESMRRTSAFR